MKNSLKFSALVVLAFSLSCSERETSFPETNSVNSLTNTETFTSLRSIDPIIRRTQNGDFVKVTLVNTTGEVFFLWRFENKWRHVAFPMTWDGLFTSPKSFRYSFLSFEELITFTGIGIGRPLYPDNDLKQDNYTQKIYLREGSLLRWIPNLAIYNQYKFNNNAISQINGTAGYTVGSDIK